MHVRKKTAIWYLVLSHKCTLILVAFKLTCILSINMYFFIYLFNRRWKYHTTNNSKGCVNACPKEDCDFVLKVVNNKCRWTDLRKHVKEVHNEKYIPEWAQKENKRIEETCKVCSKYITSQK